MPVAKSKPVYPTDELEVDDTTLEKPPVAEKTAPKPSHSTYAVKTAKGLGFTSEDVEAMTPDELQQAIHEGMIAIRAVQNDRERRPNQQDQRQPATVEQEPEDDLSDLDPRLLKKLGKLSELDEVKKELANFRQREEHRQRKENDDKLDHALTNLGAEFAKILGTESADDIKGTKAWKRRQSIIVNSGIDWSKGVPGKATLIAKFRAAANELFGEFLEQPAADAEQAKPKTKPTTLSSYLDDEDDETPKPSRKRDTTGKYVPTEEDWEQGSLRTPTSREAPPAKPGKEHAYKMARQRQLERLQTEVDDDPL